VVDKSERSGGRRDAVGVPKLAIETLENWCCCCWAKAARSHPQLSFDSGDSGRRVLISARVDD